MSATNAAGIRRGLLIPSLTTALIVVSLLALGIWQLERRTTKLDLIAALEQRLGADPVPLPPPARWRELSQKDDEFRRVTLRGVVDAAAQAQVFASPSPLRRDVSGNGVWLFAPLRLPEGATVVVNRGFVGEGRPASPPGGDPQTLTGYLRFPEASGWFTPPADRERRLWFIRDHLGMAQVLGWAAPQRLAPFYVDVEGPAPPGGVPKPGPLQVNLKNDHLQYAITWFLLAAAVTVAFAFWVLSYRRSQSVSL